MYCSKSGTKMEGQTYENIGNVVKKDVKENKILFAVLGWVFNVIALLSATILPKGMGILFGYYPGSMGFLFGYYYRSRTNKKHGTIIMICGFLSAIIGALLRIIIGE